MDEVENNPTGAPPPDCSPAVPWLLVVAGMLMDGAGRVLLQRRAAHKRHGSLWEFPGGKVEAHENPPLALAREWMEELGVALDPAAIVPCGFAQWGFAGRPDSPPAAAGRREITTEPAIVILLYTIPAISGNPRSMECEAIGWFTLEQMASLPMPEMDRVLCDRFLAPAMGPPPRC